MCESLSPLKKRKVEIDFGKCLLCQSDEKSEYRKPNIKTVQRVIDLANERNRYKDANVSEFCNRISKGGYTAEWLVIENNCVFHKLYYADYENTSKRDRAKQRYEKTILTGNIHVSRRKSGRPSESSDSHLVNPFVSNAPFLYSIF